MYVRRVWYHRHGTISCMFRFPSHNNPPLLRPTSIPSFSATGRPGTIKFCIIPLPPTSPNVPWYRRGSSTLTTAARRRRPSMRRRRQFGNAGRNETMPQRFSSSVPRRHRPRRDEMEGSGRSTMTTTTREGTMGALEREWAMFGRLGFDDYLATLDNVEAKKRRGRERK
jgi:hypothetical protein